MRLMFVNWAYEDHGSAQDLYHYAHVARALGHEVALYGRPNPTSAFNYSLDLEAAEAVIFIFEFTTYVENLDLARLLARAPRARRVVIDCDGGYNDAISLVGDANHPDEAAARRWVEVCDSLSDKVCQPTLHPLRPNVRPFLFHAYSPSWERPLEFGAKDYSMVYVGNNWFRWGPMERVLRAIEPIRDRVGRIGIVGDYWYGPPAHCDLRLPEDAFYTDRAYLEALGVEVEPPVRFDRVVDRMGDGAFTPVIYRPLFDRLRLVTCRTFETPAAAAIPLFAQEPAFVEEVYGEAALGLVLPEERAEDKILDVLRRPERYAEMVAAVRRRLAERHSYAARLQELIEIVEN